MSHPSGDLTADHDAAQAVRQHHAQLARGLEERVEALLRSVDTQDRSGAEPARHDLLDYLRRELIPHARAEERTLYPAAARQDGGALVEAMVGEHRAITALVDELATASVVRAAAAGRAVAALFAVHLAKENDLILPLLVGAPDLSLTDLLAGMHDLLGGGVETTS